MRASLRAALMMGLSACASAPPKADPVHESHIKPVVEPAPTATTVASTEPAATAPDLAKPFMLVAKFQELADVHPIGDTLAVLTTEHHGEEKNFQFEATAWELRGEKFEKVGKKTFHQWAHLDGIQRVGKTTYFSVLEPRGRSGINYLEPVSQGKRLDYGDVNAAMFARFENTPPECGKPSEGGRAPMRTMDGLYEIGKQMLIEGESCEGQRTLQVVEKKTSRFVALPDKGVLHETGFGLLLVTDHIATWDGKEFKPSTTPAPPTKEGTFLKAADGTMFFVAKDATHIQQNDAWKQVALPDGRTKLEIRSSEGGAIWALSNPSKTSLEAFKYAPAGTAAPKVVEVAPGTFDAKPDERAKPAFAKASPGPKCKSNSVVLYGFTKVTPDDYDFPLTRKAVKGHTELTGIQFVVAEERGSKYLVGKANTFEQAKKLAKVIEGGVQGSKPQVVCAEPKILRTLKIDLVTGNVTN